VEVSLNGTDSKLREKREPGSGTGEGVETSRQVG